MRRIIPAGLLQSLAAHAAILALAFGALVPQGYMTDVSAGPGIVLCTGSGPVRVAADLVGHPDKTPAAKGDMACVFAGHGLGSPLAAAPVLPAQTVVWAPQPERAGAAQLPRPGPAAFPPPAIGPPSLQA